MIEYEKFEDWMIGERVHWEGNLESEPDSGVVVGMYRDMGNTVYVKWDSDGGKAWLHVDEVTFEKDNKVEEQNTEQEIKWEAGQVVWDVLYGKGIVSGVKEDTFPVKVDFEDGDFESYKVTGSPSEGGIRTLFFSEPKIEAELFPPKKPFVPKLKKGDKIVLTDSVADYITEVVREEEQHIYYKTEDGVVTFVAKRDVKVYKLGEEIKFEEN